MDPIISFLLVLFCAGFIVGQSYLAIRHKEPPKKESQHQVMTQRDQDRGKPDEISQGGMREGQENLPQDAKLKDSGQ